MKPDLTLHSVLKKFNLTSWWLLALFISFTLPSRAQTSNSLQQVFTGQTGTISKDQSFQNVYVLTSDEIAMLNLQNLNDVLRFSLNNFSVYLGKDGYALNFNGTGRKNVKFLLNGMPMFQTSIDNFDLSKISLIDVERVEIITGSTSVFNGANAALATVNVITNEKSTKAWNGKLNINTSSRGDLNATGKAFFNFGRHSLNLAFGQYFFSGVGGTDSSRVFQWKPSIRRHEQLYYSYQILNDLRAFVSVNQINSTVQDRGYPIPNTLRAYDTDQKVGHTIIHMGIVGKISKYHTLDFSHSYTNYSLNNHKTIKILSDLSFIENDERLAFDKLHYDEYFNQIKISRTDKNKALDYEAGIEFSHQRDLERSILTTVKTNITQLSFLGNMTYTVSPDVKFKGGLRYTNSNKFTTQPIYELGMRYQMSDSATLVTNYTQGYRTPTFNEMFYTFENPDLNISGNLNLQSEMFRQFNTTLRIKSGNVSVYTTLFWANSKNGIQLELTDPSSQLYQFVNVKASKLMGQNFNFVRRSKRLDFTFSASNNGINQYPEEIGNYYFSQELLSKLLIKSPKSDFAFMVATKYISSRNETRENALGELEDFNQDGFWLLDMSLKKRLFSRSIFGYIGIKNLTNTLNVQGSYLPIDRLSDGEINDKIPLSIDYGRRYWFSLVTQF